LMFAVGIFNSSFTCSLPFASRAYYDDVKTLTFNYKIKGNF